MQLANYMTIVTAHYLDTSPFPDLSFHKKVGSGNETILILI